MPTYEQVPPSDVDPFILAACEGEADYLGLHTGYRPGIRYWRKKGLTVAGQGERYSWRRGVKVRLGPLPREPGPAPVTKFIDRDLHSWFEPGTNHVNIVIGTGPDHAAKVRHEVCHAIECSSGLASDLTENESGGFCSKRAMAWGKARPSPGELRATVGGTGLGAAAAEAKVLSALEDPSWPRKPLDIIRAGGMWTKGDRAAWEQAILAEDGVTQQRLLGRAVARMAPGVVAAKRRERMGQAMDFRTEIERKGRGVWGS